MPRKSLASRQGNEEMPGEFDSDAATAVDQNTIGAGTFEHLEDSNSALGLRAVRVSPSQPRQHFVSLADTNDVIRSFNRDTERLAMLVLGAVVSAALIFALLVQDRHPKGVDFKEEVVQAGGDLLLNANSATLFRVMGLNGKSSTGKLTPGEATSVDQAFTKIPPQEKPSLQIEAAPSTPTPVLAFQPEISHIKAQPNASSLSPTHWRDSARGIRPKIHNLTSVVLKFSDIKMRLIALWHRSEKSRSWTAFSNLNRGLRKKVSYAIEKDH
jgi:hypothetical protein